MTIKRITTLTLLILILGTTNLHAEDVLKSWGPLRMDGIGPIKMGMTVAEAEKAAGIKLPAIQETMNDCTFVAPNKDMTKIIFMVEKGKIVRTDVPMNAFDQPQSPVKTAEGIGVGASLKKVKETYQKQIDNKNHPHLNEGEGFYLLVSPKDPKQKDYLLLFEIYDKKVQTFRSGLKGPVQASEGCS